jgi:hypothetical protein
VAVGFLSLQGCSSDAKSSSSGDGGANLGGEGAGASGSGGDASGTGGDGGGDNTGGQGDTGGQTSSGGTGGGAPSGPTVCGTVIGTEEEACAELPPACGDADGYSAIQMGAASDAYAGDLAVFGLAGDDEFKGYANGTCLVGGEGSDELSFFLGDIETPATSIGVGGPGIDLWYIGVPDIGAPPVFADVESTEQIQLHGGNFGAPDGSGDAFVEIIAGFDGSAVPATKPTTRIVYDPLSGKIWHDPDGSGSEPPVHAATVGNASDVTLTSASFYAL